MPFSRTVLHEEAVLAKVAVKLIGERFCLACDLSSLRTCRGTLATGAPEGLGEIQIFAKNQLSHLVVLGSRSWGFDIFTLG